MIKLITIGFQVTIIYFSLFAATFFVFGGYSIQEVQYLGTNLFETTGEIKKSAVVSSGSGRSRSTSLEVEYTYTVENQNLTGHRVQRLPFGLSDIDAHALKKQFDAGKIVPVYYAKANPNVAVLIRNDTPIEYLSFFALAVFAFVLMFVLFYLFFLITFGRLVNLFLNRFAND